MNDSSGLRLTRRGFLAGAAGVAAVAAIPSSSRAAATAARRSPSRPRPSIAAATAGATIGAPPVYGTKNAADAASIFDNYTDTSLAVTTQKFYTTPAILAETSLYSGMAQLADVGCAFLVDLKPSKHLEKQYQKQLSAWLTMLNDADINYRCVLYSEANNVAFSSAAQWFEYWSYYAPVVKDAGVSCGYNPGCGTWASKATTFWPSNPTPDELWMDYYCTGFKLGSRLGPVIAFAQQNGVAAAGVAEWGWEASNHAFQPITLPWWNDYCGYLMNLVSTGEINLGGIYFGSEVSGRLDNVIYNSADPRISMIQQVSTTFASA
jgi:hypothetical protein